MLKLRAPEIFAQVKMAPEADGLAVWSNNKAALEKLAKLIATAKNDDALMDAAIQQASRDGVIE